MMTSGSAQTKLAIKTACSVCTVEPRDEQTAQCSTPLGLPRKTRNKVQQTKRSSSNLEGREGQGDKLSFLHLDLTTVQYSS